MFSGQTSANKTTPEIKEESVEHATCSNFNTGVNNVETVLPDNGFADFNAPRQAEKSNVHKSSAMNNHAYFSITEVPETPGTSFSAAMDMDEFITVKSEPIFGEDEADNIVNNPAAYAEKDPPYPSNVVDNIFKLLKELKDENQKYKEETERVLKRMTKEIIELKKEVKNLSGGIVGCETIFESFPMNDISEVQKLDMDLHASQEHMNDFKKYISRIGGVDVPSFLRGAMKKMFTDELATKYSWKGTKQKISSEMCYCITLLKDVCHSKFNADETVMNYILRKHFTHAQDRINKRKRLKAEVQEASRQKDHVNFLAETSILHN